MEIPNNVLANDKNGFLFKNIDQIPLKSIFKVRKEFPMRT